MTNVYQMISNLRNETWSLREDCSSPGVCRGCAIHLAVQKENTQHIKDTDPPLKLQTSHSLVMTTINQNSGLSPT